MPGRTRREVLKKGGAAITSGSLLAVVGSTTAAAAGQDYEVIITANDGYGAYKIDIPEGSADLSIRPTEYTESGDTAKFVDGAVRLDGNVGSRDPTGGDIWEVYGAGGDPDIIDAIDCYVTTEPL